MKKWSDIYIFWVKEVFCTFSMFYIMVFWITMLPCSHQFFVFQFMHSTCSEIWGLSTPNTIDQWDTTGLYSFSEQTRWIFCPLWNPSNLGAGGCFRPVTGCSVSFCLGCFLNVNKAWHLKYLLAGINDILNVSADVLINEILVLNLL